MKKSYYIIISLVLCLIFQSCTLEDFSPDEWAVEPELTISDDFVVFDSAVGIDTIAVETNYKSFVASCKEEWCQISTDVENRRLFIEVEPNSSSEQRITTIFITIERGNKRLTKNVSVIQSGGIWDTIGSFNVYWRHEISEGQREALAELIGSLQFVEGSTFYMGKGEDKHKVTLSSFYIGKFEVTQKQWNAVNMTNKSLYVGANLPVENISWADALDFVSKLSSLTNLNFSLPTEAQWEFAARGGRKSLGYIYPGSNNYNDVAFHIDTSISEENPLYTTVMGGTKIPNELGLYDMAGNVAEYCFDWFGDYGDVPTKENPTGIISGTMKVIRGGNFSDPYTIYACTHRGFSGSINYVRANTGIRVVLKP